jgi:hypothetical protein
VLPSKGGPGQLASGGFDGNRWKIVGGGCLGSITINYQNHEKLRKITKKQPKPPKLLNTTKT